MPFDEPAPRVISLVPVEAVAAAWPVALGALEKIINLDARYGVDDVRALVLRGQAQLFLQIANDTVESAVVTQFHHYPKGGLWLHVWFVGAVPGHKFDTPLFDKELERWAKANGCRGMQATGRGGWVRRLHRWHSDLVTMIFPFED